jgi:tRNA U54 and U55 pseudouridine synthase Pus10
VHVELLPTVKVAPSWCRATCHLHSCLQGSGGGVAVRSLHAATAGQLGHLKEGEQEKQKSYMAVCWLSRPLTDADVALLGATRELEVQQQTPIRVRRQERRRLPAARSQLALAGKTPL